MTSHLTYAARGLTTEQALFDLGIEHDSLAIAQGALFLTYFAPKTDSTVNSYWLGIAIEHARRIHAHDYQQRSDLSSGRQAQLKRLWWCCILRDTTLSLGLRRPLNISGNAVGPNPSFLDEQDFEDEINNSQVYDPTTKRSLVRLLSLFCELSFCLLEGLEILYPRWKLPSGDRLSTNAQEQRQRCLQSCGSRLDAWYQKTTSLELPAMDQTSYSKPLILLKNFVYMMYQ
jgi:hypothetical protein